jgi:hypothetical protein
MGLFAGRGLFFIPPLGVWSKQKVRKISLAVRGARAEIV